MANRNSAGFGLIPTRVLGQGPSTAGFGQYWIDAGDSTTIYNGEAVYSAVGSILGAQGSATAVTLGVLQGIFYNAATTIKPTWTNYYAGSITPANSEDVQAFVYDNPFQVFRCGTDDAIATTIAGAHEKLFETYGFNTTAGSTDFIRLTVFDGHTLSPIDFIIFSSFRSSPINAISFVVTLNDLHI